MRNNLKKLKSEIGRIAKIESPEYCQKEIRNLDENVNQIPNIKKLDRRDYYDFYIIQYKNYDLSGKYVGISDFRIGKISKRKFNQYHDKIEKFRKAGNVEGVSF